MSRAQQSPRHVYDDELDQWFEFDTQQEIDDFIDQASTHSSDIIEENRAPSYFAAFTLPLIGVQPIMVLPFDPTRVECKLGYNDRLTAFQSSLTSVAGSQTTPPAFTNLAVITPPTTGSYMVTASIELGAVADVPNNVRFEDTTAPFNEGFIPYSGAVGSGGTLSGRYDLIAGHVYSIQTIAAAAVGSIYSAVLTLETTASNDESKVIFGRKESVTAGQGYELYDGQTQDIDTQSEIWAVGNGLQSVNARLSVLSTTLLP